MKIALIGTGKTGQKLQDPSLLKEGDQVIPFNSKRPPTLPELKKCEVIVIFVPGHECPPLIPLLLESGKPCVWGSTGFAWPSDLQQQLEKHQLTWIYASNFSIGMSVVKKLLQELGKLVKIFPDSPEFQMIEIHHTQKKDAPSGTALSWRDWLGHQVTIESRREGDVIGLHELLVKTPREEITLKHEAKDRGIFAEGAYLAAKFLVLQPDQLSSGLHSFDKITELIFNSEPE